MHQPRDVFEADVARLQLLVVQDAHAAMAHDLVAVEREVHFLDAVALGAGAELASAPWRAAAEQDAVAWIHRAIIHGPRFGAW